MSRLDPSVFTRASWCAVTVLDPGAGVLGLVLDTERGRVRYQISDADARQALADLFSILFPLPPPNTEAKS